LVKALPLHSLKIRLLGLWTLSLVACVAVGALLLHACPLNGPIGGLTAWTMTRVQSAPGLRPLQFSFGVLLALMVLTSAWLGRTLFVWGRHVRAIEIALAPAGRDGMPAVPRTGEREFDRIIDALNEAGRRLAQARQEAEQMAVRVARAERLAGLGRVAAGIAHGIRNPIAAARLQGENALAGDDCRRRQAIIDSSVRSTGWTPTWRSFWR
jgi:signal transduction histidine kinase